MSRPSRDLHPSSFPSTVNGCAKCAGITAGGRACGEFRRRRVHRDRLSEWFAVSQQHRSHKPFGSDCRKHGQQNSQLSREILPPHSSSLRRGPPLIHPCRRPGSSALATRSNRSESHLEGQPEIPIWRSCIRPTFLHGRMSERFPSGDKVCNQLSRNKPPERLRRKDPSGVEQ